MSKEKISIGNEGIFDAKTLGAPRMIILGLQHMFAMFGATVLVPVLTGLSVSSTLLFAGLGTLLFHIFAKGKIPAFLGSSFTFIGGYLTVAGMGTEKGLTTEQSLVYACFGVACAGLLYFVLAALIKIFGAKKVMRFFPPIVTGPIIISIGLTLSGSAIQNCQTHWGIAAIAILIVIACNIWGKGMTKITPIIIGVLGSVAVAVIFELCNGADVTIFDPQKIENIKTAAWIGLPFKSENTVFAMFGENFNGELLLSSVLTIMPIALATMVEHIGDICAISSTTGKNYIQSPGLHRTLMGDGLATALASLFGAPANTTYGENTGVLNLTKVFDPFVVRIAAYFAILFSFSPKFAAVISCMPVSTIGGISLILYGMISAVGVRNIVENKVDFTKSRNVIIAAIIMVLAIGIKYGAGDVLDLGLFSLTGLASAAIVGIILNAILPGKDYEFGADEKGDKAVNFAVGSNTENYIEK